MSEHFRYESNYNVVITCSTKVCSFGKQVVEKVETEYSRLENSRFVYRINRSPMCEYMINFIQKLKHLPERYMMNSVLENFTILQVSENHRIVCHVLDLNKKKKWKWKSQGYASHHQRFGIFTKQISKIFQMPNIVCFLQTNM